MLRQMSTFRERLAAVNPEAREGAPRRWVYAPYDQLTDRVGPLADAPPETLGLVLVECPEKAARRPYHRRKLAFVLAAGRRFALEQAARGVAVRHLVAEDGEGFAGPLGRACRDLGPVTVMEPAERELRHELAPLIASGALVTVPHAGWLTTPAQFRAAVGPKPPWRMDRFYRAVRKATGLLVESGTPVGGKWSFDAENRRPWRGEPPAPSPPRFEHGEIEREVEALVRERYADHPGEADLAGLATTRADARRAWRWFIERCLPHFGDFEDAMSAREVGLFHARIATYLNVHLLTPLEVVTEVVEADAPLAAREGFVRQVLGWREFVRHVHAATDGFRDLNGRSIDTLGADEPLPPVYWRGAWERREDATPAAIDTRSGLSCLDTVVERVWREGYSHHIERLMVLSNLATLLGISPRELTDWFWVAYTDAYDWVVEPNVLGMGTYALGDLMVTKPYVSGAAYIARMGDFCAGCAFDPKRDCPVTDLYWAFLARNAETLAGNARMALPLKNAAARSTDQRAMDQRVSAHVVELLGAGGAVTPDSVRRARRGERASP